MNYLIEISVTIVGVLMSVAYFPQAYKIFKNKSATNISLPSYLTFGFGTLVWMLYGLYKADWVITLSFGVGVLGSWLVISGVLLYRK